MGAEKRCLRCELGSDPQRTRLIVNAEAVATLDLDRGRSLGAHLDNTRADKGTQRVIIGGPGGPDRVGDAASVVLDAGHPCCELRRTVPGKDEVRV
jgi:hypothetical protein